MERNCWYCHKPLPITKLLKKDLFCSNAHEEQYFAEQNAAAFARMKELDPEVEPAVNPADPIPAEPPSTAPVAAAPALPLPSLPPPAPRAPVAAPVEQPPPMAELLKSDLFLAEPVPSALVPENPLLPVPEPARPSLALIQADCELSEGGLIQERFVAQYLMTGPTGGFEEFPFADTEHDIPQDAVPQPRLDMRPRRRAEQVPAWTGEIATGPSTSGLVPESSMPGEVFPQISTLKTQVHTHFRATAYSAIPRIAAIAPSTQLGFAISPSFQNREKLAAARSFTPDAPGLTPRGTISQALTVRPEACPDRAFPADFDPPPGHFSKAGTLPGVDVSRSLADAPVSGGWKISHPPKLLRPATLASSWTNSHNPAVAARSGLDAGAGPQRTLQLSAASPFEIPPSAAHRIVRTWPAATAELESRGAIRILQLRHNLALPSLSERPVYADSSVAARQTERISFGLHARIETMREAEFHPVSFDPLSALALAVAQNVGPALAGASVARLIPAGHHEPAPASFAANPRAVRPASAAPQSAPRIERSPQALAGKAAFTTVSTIGPQTRTHCQTPASLTVLPAFATPQSAPRIDRSPKPVPGKTQPGTVSIVDHQTRTGCRTPENNASRPSAAAIRARTPWVSMLSWHNDSAIGSEVEPLPHIPPHPASMVVPPDFSAMVEAGWATQAPSVGDLEFLAKRSLLSMPFQAVLHAPVAPAFADSTLPACRGCSSLSQLPVSNVPRPAACFGLDLPLRDVAYARGGSAQKNRL